MRKKYNSLLIILLLILLARDISAQLQNQSPWPMFHQNLQHTGQTNKNVSGPKKNIVRKWTYSFTFGGYSSPVIAPDNTIYFGAYHGLYAITNGIVKWTTPYPNAEYCYVTPAIDNDGTIYSSDYQHVYALDSNKNLKWAFSIGANIYSSPVIGSNHIVYFGANNGKLYAVTNGQIKWTNRLGNAIQSSPALGQNGTIYVGCANGKLYAITNGQIKWTNNLGGAVTYSSPAIAPDGTIYIGTFNNKFYAITNGQIKWTNHLGGAIESSAAVDSDGTIYVGCNDYKLYAFNADGSLKWTNKFGNAVKSSPAVDKDHYVYVGCENNNIYAVSNGIVKWTNYINGPYTIGYASPAIGNDGTLYIAAIDRLCALIENHEPQLVWSSNIGYSNDGVQPNDSYNGQYFRFEVKYIDIDKNKPSTNQVWIDLNDNDNYDSDEKFSMYSNSGTSYSNGIIYTNLKQIFYTGDGIINYQFHFTDKYGYVPLPCAPISNHLLTVTNTNIPHAFFVTKNPNYSGLFDSYTNNSVLSFQLWDTKHGHQLINFKMGNVGTMIPFSDYSNVKLWFDQNENHVWDQNDIYITNLQWNGISLWSNIIQFKTNLSFPRNFIVILNLTTNAQISNSFKAYIPAQGIECSGFSNIPLIPITNQGFKKIGSYLNARTIRDMNVVYSSFSNLTSWVIQIKGLKQTLLKQIKIGNAGSMLPVQDIKKLKLWYDKNLNQGYDAGDTFISELNWDSSAYWTNNNISYNSNLLNYNQFVITADFAYTIKGDRTFRPHIPAYGVHDNYNKSAPTNAITNNGNISIYQGFVGPVSPGRQYGTPALESGDINNNSSIEFLITGFDGSKYLDKYINNQDGSFTGPTFVSTGDDANSMAMGDINNDGNLDFVLSDGLNHVSSYKVRKFLNNGSGTFNESLFGVSCENGSITLGDINNDGSLDLITSGMITGLCKHINDSHGNFTNFFFGRGVYNSSIALGDINNDGSLDLIVSGDDGVTFYLEKYTNDGHANFDGPFSIGPGIQYGAVSLGDINDDGNLDLIVSGSGRLDKYINDGAGNFSGTAFGTGVSVPAQALGDIDNDGDLDLVVGGIGTATVKIYTNNGTGNFPTSINLMNDLGLGWSTYRGAIILNDLDNDNDLDLVLAGHYGTGNRRFAIYYNTLSRTNNPPTIPNNLSTTTNNGFWKFTWNTSSDDHTSNKLLRYKIAIKTNITSAHYITTNMNYPHGQANLGNVCVSTGHSYQSTIPIFNKVFYKVCAIDTSFKNSSYSAESIAVFPLIHNLTQSKDYGKFYYALAEANKGDHLQADPYIYHEQIKINHLTNIILESTSYVNSHITTNTIIIITNKSYVLKITNSKNITFQGFTLKSATNGITLQNCSYNHIMNNIIKSNMGSGIKMEQANYQDIRTNIIINNQNGIQINNSTSSTLYRNALYHNLGHGTYLNNANNNSLINNSFVSNGLASGDGMYLNNALNNMVKNNIIAFTKNGYGVNQISGSGNNLNYNDVYNNTPGNYNNITPNTGAITNDPLINEFNIYASNFLSIPFNSPCIDKGDPNDSAPLEGNNKIDMGWKEFVEPYLNIALNKIITNITLNTLNASAIPGASIEYKINCEVNSYGNKNGTNIILYDKADDNITYKTDYSLVTGWTTEYSTNLIPNQAYISPDYSDIRPEKEKIKWIRWKKNIVNKGTYPFFIQTIIK